MKIKIDKSGLRNLNRQLEELQSHKTVSFAELFSPDFMAVHTDFATFDEMLDASGFQIESMEDLQAVPDAEWDEFIAKRTRFSTWLEMQGAAGKLHVDRLIKATLSK